jgi:hypothetical protein
MKRAICMLAAVLTACTPVEEGPLSVTEGGVRVRVHQVGARTYDMQPVEVGQSFIRVEAQVDHNAKLRGAVLDHARTVCRGDFDIVSEDKNFGEIWIETYRQVRIRCR